MEFYRRGQLIAGNSLKHADMECVALELVGRCDDCLSDCLMDFRPGDEILSKYDSAQLTGNAPHALSNFEIRTLCHCFRVFGEAVSSLISG